MRVGNNSPVDQSSLQSQSTSTKATPQQAPQTQSAFQGDAVRQGTSSGARMKNAEASISSSLLANSLRGDSTSLKSVMQNIDKMAAPSSKATSGVDKFVATNSVKAAILDNKTTTSKISITQDGTVDKLKLNLDIDHTYRGDLVVKITSPSGKTATISNKEGGSADNIKLTGKDLSALFPGESIKGDWTLTVQDTARQDQGTLNSWSLDITPKTGGNTPPPPATGPTLLHITGDAAFTQKAAADLAKFAPGTTVDAQGYVHEATTKTAGHDQGYQLISNLLNGGNGNNKQVEIQFVSQNAFTSSDPTAQVLPGGTPGRATANTGSKATVSYDPTLKIDLPTLQPDGTIKNEGISSEIILAHELVHATHAQRGTIDRTLVDHTFTNGNQTLKENWRFEEFRTTGFPGNRQGSEPSENSIRAELGFHPRATYLFSDSWQPTNGIAKNVPAVLANSSTAANYVRDLD